MSAAGGFTKTDGVLTFIGLLFLLAVLFGLGWGCPTYRVWQQRLEGEAELSHATYSRQIAVQEANAKMEAAKMLSQADTIRAHGEARANEIIGNSLTGERGQARLRYLWIQGLEQGEHSERIYIPTEAGLPITEARDHP